ncbi:AAA family ATPase [Nitrospirillum amazonense]|uniref:AAA family ATPase n=1 Tax=Nitrospirillum amazonense TaxID=28077 RepID=UPI002DD42A7B|nr:AAA family ATPase [Nitrospirillum amazonense]MEC4593803.1 AAA family ATPase [Nitrospirillum amazonense]
MTDDFTAQEIDQLLGLSELAPPDPDIDVQFARIQILDAMAHHPAMDEALAAEENEHGGVWPMVRPTAGTIIVPHAGWLPATADALRDLLNGSTEVRVDDHWLVTVFDQATGRRAGDQCQQALRDGRSVIGVATNDEHIPLALRVFAADMRLPLPSPTAEQLGQFMLDVTGDGGTPLQYPGHVQQQIGPEDLRRSWSRQASPGEWAERLGRVVDERLREEENARTARATFGAVNGGAPSEPTLHDLAGMTEAVTWGLDLARDLADYRTGGLLWDAVDHGVLLAGGPGTGKTTFAAALALTCGVPLVTGSHSSWQAAGHQGEMLKAMAATFADAVAQAPCILFIDEFDSFSVRVGTSQAPGHLYHRQVVNGLLQHLDGIADREGVVVIAATNMPETVDPALLRPGRIERTITIPQPDTAALIGMLRFHLGNDLRDADLYQTAAIAAAAGATGATIAAWVRNARRLARLAHRPMRLADLLGPLLTLDTAPGGTAVTVAASLGRIH